MRIRANGLNLIANVSLIAASGALGTTIWYRLFHDRQAAAKGSSAFHPGERAPQLPGVNYSSSERSLVVFLSTTCPYCESSVPFYNKLESASVASNHRWNLYAVFWQPADRVRAFKARVNLAADALSGVDFRNYGVHSTPTLLLVDRIGVIKRVWLGASLSNETEIVAALGRPAAN